LQPSRPARSIHGRDGTEMIVIQGSGSVTANSYHQAVIVLWIVAAMPAIAAAISSESDL
jgi:hypothetical protein